MNRSGSGASPTPTERWFPKWVPPTFATAFLRDALSESTISPVYGKAALTAEMALRIHKAFGPDVDHLLRMQVAYDVAQVRKRAKEIKVKRYVAKAA